MNKHVEVAFSLMLQTNPLLLKNLGRCNDKEISK